MAAFVVRLMSPLFRAAQTGFTQNYALVMVLGLVAAVAMFFGADILKAFRNFLLLGFERQLSVAVVSSRLSDGLDLNFAEKLTATYN